MQRCNVLLPSALLNYLVKRYLIPLGNGAARYWLIDGTKGDGCVTIK